MDTLSIFEVLVHHLSEDERQKLLKLIRTEDQEPQPAESMEIEEVPSDILAESYEKMNFFQKLVIFFLSLFTGEKKVVIVEKRILNHLKQTVHSGYPSHLDPSGSFVLPGFFSDIKKISDQSEALKPVFQVLHSSSKPALMAMLGELMMSTDHERISRLADFEPYRKAGLEDEPKVLKRRILAQLEDDLAAVDPEERKKVYESVRRLYLFQNLIEFDFSRILGLQGNGTESVDLSNLGELLKKLTGIMASLQGLPAPACLDALILFQAAAANHNSLARGWDPETAGKTVRSALLELMEWRNRIPLTGLTRISLKDIYYVPDLLPAGEDWFLHYKSYWTNEIKKRVSRFFWDKERVEIQNDILSLLKIKNLPLLPNYRRSAWPDHVSLKFDLPLSGLKAMAMYYINGRAYPVMRKVFIDGDFYRIDNRQQFLDSYNYLHKLQEQVDETDALMGKDGPIGSALDALKSQSMPEDLKRERMQILADEAERNAEELLRQSVKYMGLIVDVSRGILYPQSGGSYDSLRNLADIDGKRNKDFLAELEETAQMYDSLKGLFERLLDNCLGTVTG
jgi:hypothetical protein